MTEQPLTPADQPKQKRGWVKPTLLTVGGLVVVGSVVSALNGDPAEHDHDHGPVPTETVTAQPEPAPTVTETAEPEVVTETVTVTEVPQACLEVIALGGELDTVYRQIGDVLVGYIEIIQSMDTHGYATNDDLIKFEETVRANEEINAERDAVFAKFMEKAVECEAASGDGA